MCEEQMVRGGKVSSKKNFRNRFRPKDKGSDDSDEDYVVSNEENGVTDCSDDDYCSSLDGCVSGEDREEVVEERRKKTRKTVGPKARNRNGLGTHKVRQRNERKRRRLSYEEEEDDGDEDYKVDDDNDYEAEEEVEVEEEEEDYVDEEEEEEEVEEEDFTPEEEEFSDEEELFVRTRGNNMKLGQKAMRKRTSRKVSKRKKLKAAKKPSRNAGRRNHGWRNVRISDDDEFSDNDLIVANTRSKRPVPKRKRCVTRSDLDILLSGSSDYEYTISEEEREQVREAERLCGSGSLNTRARSITSPQKTELNLRRMRKPPVRRKGKEKLEEVKAEVVKQVCGICLSEEDKRRVRGTLNCCSHFFCFSCIMEWAKVESRCPLCKQRFQTISKPARSAAGIDLREVVIQVPERDQVYQPSEEELRSYLDPYENVICTECHEGGDDNLMLLCDLCDSPAHTYCVGLGREVPVGSWYCVDCRTNSMGSSSSQASGRLSDRRTFNNLFNRPIPVVSREGLDLNSLSSPRTPHSQGFSNVASPRFPLEVQSSSPISQAAAPTIVGRRIIRLHISQIRSSNQMGGFVNNRTDGVSTANISGSILNSQIGRARETAFEHIRPREMALPSQTSLFGEGLHENPSPLMQHEDFLDSESSHLSRQAIQDPQISMSTNITGNRTILNPLQRLAVENTTMTVDRNVNGALWPEHGGVNSLSNCEQIYHHHSVLNVGTDDGLPPPVRDGKDYCEAREQLQPIIESHLKNLSRDIDLGQSTSADIATKATCTILAACGFENLINEAYQASPPCQCPHNIEMSMGECRRSLIKGICSSCFDAYVEDVVKKITDASLSSWLSLTL